jgi:hypothetical protein
MHLAKRQDSAPFNCKLKSQRLQFNFLKGPLVVVSVGVNQPDIQIDMANGACILIEVCELERIHDEATIWLVSS